MPGARVLVMLAVATGIRLVTARLAPEHFHLIDPFVVAVIWAALSQGVVWGQLAGLGAGWIQDGLSGSLFGLHAFADVLVGYLAAVTAQRFAVGRRPALLAVFALGAAVQQAVVAILLLLLVADRELPEAGLPLLARVVATALLGIFWVEAEARLARRYRHWRRSRRGRLS